MNVVDYLLDNQTSGDHTALITPSGEYSYRDLRQAVADVGDFLVRSGIRKGDRVLLLSDNSFFWIACYLASLRTGAVSVPLAPTTSAQDLKFIFESCGINLCFIQGKLEQNQWGAIPSECQIVLASAEKVPEASKQKCVCFETLLMGRVTDNAWPDIDEQKDLAAIMFTSGSTSSPRGVMVSHWNIMANTSSIVEYMDLTCRDRIMVVLPFFYCFGTSLLHTHLRVGGSIVIDPRFMFPDKVLVRMQETRCTGFAGVPSHYQLLLRKSSFKAMQFPDLRYLQQAGGKLSDLLIRELQSAVPSAKLFVMYGQTEATARLSYLPPHLLDKKLGSIGKGIPGTRLSVVNASGMPVVPGEVGEIVAEGGNITLGYWGADEEHSATFRDGQLYTGDLATVDDDGFIYIADRSKDILKCGGRRSPCKQVEEALLEFDELVEAAVIGVPDDLLGEAVKAFVVPKKKGADLVGRLQAFCMRRLPPYLMPREIVVLDELPKNSGGKILKPALRMVN